MKYGWDLHNGDSMYFVVAHEWSLDSREFPNSAASNTVTCCWIRTGFGGSQTASLVDILFWNLSSLLQSSLLIVMLRWVILSSLTEVLCRSSLTLQWRSSRKETEFRSRRYPYIESRLKLRVRINSFQDEHLINIGVYCFLLTSVPVRFLNHNREAKRNWETKMSNLVHFSPALIWGPSYCVSSSQGVETYFESCVIK